MQQHIFCANCDSAISLRDVKQIGIWVQSNGELKVVVRYLCPKCKRVGEEFIETSARIPMTVSAMTEMSLHERKKFSQMKPITSDEIIEFYRYLRNLRSLPLKKLKEKRTDANEKTTHPSHPTRHLI